MKKSAKELRATAREGLKGNWLVAILAWLLAIILGAGTSFNFNFNYGGESGDSIANDPQAVIEEVQTTIEQMPTEAWVFLGTFLSIFLGTALIITTLRYVIGSATQLGYNKFNIDLIDNVGVDNAKDANIGTLFSGFKIFFKAFGLRLFIDLFTFLWLLLFVIPGIIAQYRYAMAPYIMAENHNVGIREAVNLSKKMMDGYKWRLFCLNLSFIGWMILSVLTCGILLFRTVPYMQAANAAFYRMVADNYAANQN